MHIITIYKLSIGLGNDHKAIMKQIEAKIHDIHAEAREKGLVSSATTQGQEQTKIIAFASVSTVSDGSPASSAVRLQYCH